jgi:ankyrin repeat protein
MSIKDWPNYLGLNAAQGRRLAKRRLLLQDSGTATAALALEDCRLVTGAGAAVLDRKDPYTHETPLIARVQLGEFENAKRLLQAGADANASTAGGERALLIAAKEGREDLMELLAGFKADLNVRYDGWTVLHTMTHGKGNPAVVQALVKAGAMLGRLSAGRPP